METAIIFCLAILLEICVRLIPSKVNLSVLDKLKSVALQLHSFVDIIIPNNVKES
jgi:hypothetical protein